MARRREFDEDAAIGAVKARFWLKGYEGASYADIMEATGRGKGSLYAAFGDKRALYLSAVDAYVREEVAGAVDVLEGDGSIENGVARVDAFLSGAVDAVERRGDRRGCFICNAAVELAPFDEDVETATIAGMDAMRNALKSALGVKSALADHVLAAYFGLRVMAKAGAPASRLKRAKNAAMSLLRGEAPA
ncbi:MAG: TetR/AcrR family transcriptional regulator [Parvularculaceae bacterium]